MAPASQEVSFPGPFGPTIEILEALVSTEGEQGTHPSAISPRFTAAKEVSIEDVSKDRQPSDLVDVDLQILSGEAHLCPSALRIMQSTLEASGCSIWPSISKSTFQETAEREWRKEESRAEFQPRGGQGWKNSSSGRCDLQHQVALGGELAAWSSTGGGRKGPSGRGQCSFADSARIQADQFLRQSYGRGGCGQTPPASQGLEAGAWIPSCRAGAEVDHVRGEGPGESAIPWASESSWKTDQTNEEFGWQDSKYGRRMATIRTKSGLQIRRASQTIPCQQRELDARIPAEVTRTPACKGRSSAGIPTSLRGAACSPDSQCHRGDGYDDGASSSGGCSIRCRSIRRLSGRSSCQLGGRRAHDGLGPRQHNGKVGAPAFFEAGDCLTVQGSKSSSQNQRAGEERSANPDEVNVAGVDMSDVFEILTHGPNIVSASCPLVGMCDDETYCTDDSQSVWGEELVQPCPDLSSVVDPSVLMPWAKSDAQLGPHQQPRSFAWPLTDDPPCPCDRWCGDSVEVPNEASFRSRVCLASHQGAHFKTVSFDTKVDIFGFDPDSSADSLPEEWWTVDDDSPGLFVADSLQQSSPLLTIGDGSAQDPFQTFWKDWYSLWLPLQDLFASNGPSQHWDGCHGRFDGIPEGNSGHVGFWKENRNEGGLAAGAQDPRLTDPRAYVPEPPEDDSDDDLGVTFFRWIDVLSLTDLHPYRQGGSIPFITFGLRGHHLGRRDFSSPDMLPGRMKELVWNLWQDEVGRFEQVHIHFIRPQPTRELGAEGVIILRIEILCEEIPPASSPALAVTCDTSNRLMDSPKALYVDRAVDVPSLLPHFGLSYLCAPRGFRQCAFTVASASIGAYFAPVPEGALIKMTVGAKLRIFAQAFEWFPDLERFAAVVREQVRQGVQDHGLVFHSPGTQPVRFGFRIGQLLHPPQLRDNIQQICGDAIKACYPVDHDALNAMLGRASGDFHALVYLQGQPLDHAFVVVTGCDELRQDSRRCRAVVCLRDSYSDLRALHLHLCGIDTVAHQAMRHDDFMFQHDGRLVHDLHAIPFGAVILHSVLQAPQDEVAMDDDEGRSGSEELCDDPSDDSLSLLQIQPGLKSVKLLQFGHPVSDLVISHDSEDVERCTIMSMLPSRFAEIQEWSSRSQVNCDSGLQDAELLVDPMRRDGLRDIIAECVSVGA